MSATPVKEAGRPATAQRAAEAPAKGPSRGSASANPPGHDRPYLASEKDLAPLGLHWVDEAERPARARELLDKMRHYRRTFQMYMDVCTHCGACAQQCHSYLGTQDPKNMPVARADLARRIYQRYFTWTGRHLPRLVGAEDLTEETIEAWYKYFYQCNECRRCAVFCPFGIDTAEITIAMREILAYLGLVPRFLTSVGSNVLRTGNNMGIPRPALLDTVQFLEEEMKEETGKDIPIPVDQEGAEVLYNPSSSDFFSNPDTLTGAAKMFYAAGISWTLSSEIIETANFGLFFSEPLLRAHSQRLIRSARRLRVQRIVAGECGHGWRTWRMFSETIHGQLEFPITHCAEEACELLRQRRIRVDPEANPQRVTYHDPCNLARAGDIIEQPREVLRQITLDFREMIPNREKSFCCGGGSGLLMDEMMEVRMQLGKAKADSVRATGAEILCAPCAICKAQLPLVMEHHHVPVQVKGLLDLLGRAIIL
ncbi:MAG: (Fe-S)-binding protein [Firmicutes bacterium]|nr:(Fe-S)-binding protein [Bacillota bacterium]